MSVSGSFYTRSTEILINLRRKFYNLRFDVLLAQYLSQHKKLNLPGIGIFETDSSTVTWDENGKQKGAGNGIVFRHVPVVKADDDLIAFISEHTGKMKPLAISDLESYLTLGKQFLYIGKPFYLEGIGTLQFSKGGNFDFTPGEFITTKLEEPAVEKVEERKKYEEEERTASPAGRGSGRAVLIWILVLIGLGLAGWGGYYYYKNYIANASSANQSAALDSTSNNQYVTQPASTENPGATTAGVDTSRTNRPATAQGNFYDKDTFKKFIVESTTDKQRALNRYRKLKAFGNDIELQTADSVHFTLFFVLPSTNADTLRIRDSLNRWYYGNNKVNRVVIAQ